MLKAVAVAGTMVGFLWLTSTGAAQIYSIAYSDLKPGATNNLTTAGTVDWVKWGNGETGPPFTTVQKEGGALIKPALTALGTVPAGQTVVLVPFSPVTGVTPVFVWTNGNAPMASGTPIGTSVSETITPNQSSYPVGLGLSFQSAADVNPHAVSLYVAGFNARMKLSASLGSGGSGSLLASNAALIPVLAGTGSNVFSFGVFSILYSGAGETLTVSLTADNQTGIPNDAPQFGFPNAGALAATVALGELPPAPIVLSQPNKPATNTFQFAFTNAPGLSFSVLATTNLVVPFGEWELLGHATEISSGQFQFTDLQATSAPSRFYRVRLP